MRYARYRITGDENFFLIVSITLKNNASLRKEMHDRVESFNPSTNEMVLRTEKGCPEEILSLARNHGTGIGDLVF